MARSAAPHLNWRVVMDFVVAGFISVGVLVYLGYALFNPEKF